MHALKVLEFEAIKSQLLGHIQTEMGGSLASNLVPSFEPDEVWNLLFETEEAYELLGKVSFPSLAGLTDERPEIKRASKGGILEAKDLGAIGQALGVMVDLRELLTRKSEATRLAGNAERLPDLGNLAQAIDRVTDGTEIRDSASPELAQSRKKRGTLQARRLEVLQGLVNGKTRDLLSDPLYTVREGRYVLPLKAENKGKIRGIVHDSSASGQTIYVEPEGVLALSNEIREVEGDIRREELKVLTHYSKQVGAQAEAIRAGYDALGKLDLIVARAQLAYQMKANVPVALANTGIEVENGRHPLLDPKSVVPVSLSVAPGHSVVITGPNTGGKTVAIKSIGLFVLMAQCGMFVPSTQWKFCPFTRVFADIGDEQSLHQSLSTFSGHIKNIAEALSMSQEGALILLDEVGAGTDPAEGAALARAILEEFDRRGCAVLASTHYAELKAFAFETPGFINAAMEFDNKNFRPTYRLIMGSPGASQALRIAERYKIPSHVVEGARLALGNQQQSLAGMMESLELSQRLARQAQGDADRKLNELREKETRINKKLEEADAIRQQVRAKSEEAIEDVLRDLRLEAEALFEELKRNPADARVQAHVREGLRGIQSRGKELADKHRSKQPSPTSLPKLEPGLAVRVRGYSQVGVVLEAPKGNKVQVQIGPIKMAVAVHLVEVVESKPGRSSVKSQIMLKAAQTVQTELHLRAMRAEEAEIELEKFLDDAVMARLEKVRIVHGKGEGILREMTHQVLKLRSDVQDYHDADPAEGGFGVTVVHFK